MIGIMSAMQEEIDSLLSQIENVTRTRKGKRTYHHGTLFGTEVVLVFSRWGKVASATTATQLINDFELDEIIFTGVAGAIDDNLDIGDIVIGEQLVQHDMNTAPLFSRFEIPLLGKTYFETNPKCRKKLTAASKAFVTHYHQRIPEKESKKLGIQQPQVCIGNITSGDQFISQPEQVEFITDNLDNILCTEMEGAAVAQVCYEYQVPFGILRIISDKTNDDSPVDFPYFAKHIASKYALEIFRNYLRKN